MKREDIEKLLKDNGVVDDKIKVVVDMVMAENGKDIETEKAKTIAKDGELAKANETITGLQTDIKKFDGVDVEGLKTKASDWETRYATDLASARAESEKLKKEYTLKEALKSSGVTDADYIIYKHGGVEKFSFGGDGKVIGLDDTLKPYKVSAPEFFKSKEDTTNQPGPLVFNSALPHGLAPATGGEMKFNFMGVRPTPKE